MTFMHTVFLHLCRHVVVRSCGYSINFLACTTLIILIAALKHLIFKLQTGLEAVDSFDSLFQTKNESRQKTSRAAYCCLPQQMPQTSRLPTYTFESFAHWSSRITVQAWWLLSTMSLHIHLKSHHLYNTQECLSYRQC